MNASLYAARGIVTDTPLINEMQSVLRSPSLVPNQTEVPEHPVCTGWKVGYIQLLLVLPF